MRDSAIEVEVAIIGAGPIGIEVAIALKHARVPFALIDAGNIGSTFTWWAPGTRFFSSPERIAIAGVPLVTPNQEKATREEYLAYLRGVVQQFEIEVVSGTRVDQVERAEHDFALTTNASTHGVGGADGLRARRVVLAIGNMHRPRMIGVPGENLSHVSHYLADPHGYFGRRVLIVGGKNSAVEAAIRLYRVGAQVAISYRGESFDPKRVKYWLRPELEWLISKGKIAFHPRTEVEGIGLGSVRLRAAGQDPISLNADDVLLLTGYVQDTTLFEQLGVQLECDERAPKHDSQTMQTSATGVYVAGTAAGGSQKRAKLFIENTHVHVQRILRDIAGVDVPWKIEGDYGAQQEA